MIWIISDVKIPDTGDIERDEKDDLIMECNKLSVIKQICKLFKPSLWNNMGFGFVSPKQFEKIKNSKLHNNNNNNNSLSSYKTNETKKPRMTRNSLSCDSSLFIDDALYENIIKTDSDNESSDFSRDSSKKVKVNDNFNKLPITEEVFKTLPKPPQSIWRRGKRSNEDKIKIRNWENELKSLGYDPSEYKKYVSMKKSEENLEPNYKLNQLAILLTSKEFMNDLEDNSIGESVEENATTNNEIPKPVDKNELCNNNSDVFRKENFEYKKQVTYGNYDLEDITSILFSMSQK